MNEHRLAETVRRAWLVGVSLQSDFARSNAPYVAAAASVGLLTTKTGLRTFGQAWRPTSAGLRFLEALDQEPSEEQLQLPL